MIPLLKKLDRYYPQGKASNQVALKSVPVPAKVEESWNTSAKDALRVETVCSEGIISADELASYLQPSATPEIRLVPSQLDLEPANEPKSLAEKVVDYVLEKQNSPAEQPEIQIGVFSDSKIYSAMIKQELKQHSVKIGHFHHPKTLYTEAENLLSGISAWIIFLSEEDESGFLDDFMDRYGDKETLFIFEKMTRRQTSQKIQSFIESNQLDSGH